tara:strand:+ start:449 stop:595 length:147 start_codon:yes stop_codon:yes gene_type:complete
MEIYCSQSNKNKSKKRSLKDGLRFFVFGRYHKGHAFRYIFFAFNGKKG